MLTYFRRKFLVLKWERLKTWFKISKNLLVLWLGFGFDCITCAKLPEKNLNFSTKSTIYPYTKDDA